MRAIQGVHSPFIEAFAKSASGIKDSVASRFKKSRNPRHFTRLDAYFFESFEKVFKKPIEMPVV